LEKRRDKGSVRRVKKKADVTDVKVKASITSCASRKLNGTKGGGDIGDIWERDRKKSSAGLFWEQQSEERDGVSLHARQGRDFAVSKKGL